MVASLTLLTVLFLPAALEEKPAQAYPQADLLVEATELARPEVARKYLVLDVRSQEQYADGHIPGAVWVDLSQWKGPSISPEKLGMLGIGSDTAVVLYDDNASKDAARVWWILKSVKHAHASLLNGGWQAWKASGGPISKEPSSAKAATAVVAGDKSARLATKDDVLKGLKEKSIQLVDARSEKEFCGDTATARRNGSIPGARHLEWSDLLDPRTKRFKGPEELTKLFKEAGIDLDRPTVTYCQSGGRASVMAFGLELMGAKNVRNYYKSWAEWGNDADTPIEKPKK